MVDEAGGRSAGRDDRVLAVVGRAFQRLRRACGADQTVGAARAPVVLRPDRRPDRLADQLIAGADRRRPQFRLPLFVDPRRIAVDRAAVRAWLDRGRDALPRLAVRLATGQEDAVADGLPRRWR